jgi:hypothetical protein
MKTSVKKGLLKNNLFLLSMLYKERKKNHQVWKANRKVIYNKANSKILWLIS